MVADEVVVDVNELLMHQQQYLDKTKMGTRLEKIAEMITVVMSTQTLLYLDEVVDEVVVDVDEEMVDVDMDQVVAEPQYHLALLV